MNARNAPAGTISPLSKPSGRFRSTVSDSKKAASLHREAAFFPSPFLNAFGGLCKLLSGYRDIMTATSESGLTGD